MTNIDIDCPACSANRISDRWKAMRLPGNKEVAWCGNCGMGWLHPFPTDDEVHGYYNDTDALSYVIQNDTEKREGFKHRINQLRKLAPERGRLLDVGSGLGHFLSMAQEDGWDVEGVELQKSAAKYCTEHFEIEPHVGYVEALDLTQESFDVVTLWDVLEHTHKPLEFLRNCAQLVRPGGLLVVAIPNASGWPARMLKGRWRYVMTHHLSYFTTECINRILIDNGLSVVKTNHTMKVQSILHGLEPFLPWAINSEQLMRIGREGGIEKNHFNSGQVITSSRIDSVKKGALRAIRKLMFKLNLVSLKWPVGDLMDIYCRKISEDENTGTPKPMEQIGSE